MSSRGVRKSGKPGSKQQSSPEGKKQPEVVPNSPLASTSMMYSSSDSPDSKEATLSFPLVKISDNAKTLPRYTAILGRSEKEGISMEDLDTLQLELEVLLSAAAVRIRALQGEVGTMENQEEKKDKKSRIVKTVKKSGSKLKDEVPSKRSRESGSKSTETQSPLPIKFTKVKNPPATLAPSNFQVPDIDIDALPKVEVNVSDPKNDVPNKFWASVEPYCSEITTADIQVLKDLISANANQASALNIPPLGKHYSALWIDEEVTQDANPPGKTKAAHNELYLKKAEKLNVRAAAAGPITQRIVSALLEEGPIPSSKHSLDSGKDDTMLRAISNGLSLSGAASLESRMRKELMEMDLFDPKELQHEADDEIFEELKLCHEEMNRVNEHNVKSLQRLLKCATEEMGRQEIRRKLHQIDAQLVEMHKKIVANKIKRKIMTKKEQEPIWKLLRDRDALIKHLDATIARPKQ
ncbi:transcriptional adapter 3 [Neocloeon triangulifer]|uniref:transcriptional adapter 3 n=1 Tax=Neocloeon triangulifer TaxID=2078957 RepID=UPI00286F016A|nr:transcriptional adapter 3 [Neocloeon triangulifer]